MKALDRTLPASALIRRGAPPWQVAHALSFLAWRYLRERPTRHRVNRVHSDLYGWLHHWITGQDCGTVGGWRWTKARKLALADRVERIERRLK